MTASLRKNLQAVFDADRQLRRAESLLMRHEGKELRSLLSRAVAEAEGLEDRGEACLRLQRLADLCAQAPGADTLDALVRMLDYEDPEVRLQASEALVDLGFDRYRPFVAAVERALKRAEPSAAHEQLPWIIAEIGEADAEKLIARFLPYPEAAIAGAAVEALISLGTPEALAAIEPLKDDPRLVELDPDHGGEVATISIGQLVRSFIGPPAESAS